MPELLAQHHVDVEVDFFGFCLQDADDTAVPVPYPEGRAGTGFVSVLAGRIDVESAGHTHLNNDDAAATMGWAVVYRFTDNGITASDPLVERPALLRLLRTLRARGTSEGFSVCGVIAVEEERLARLGDDYSRLCRALSMDDDGCLYLVAKEQLVDLTAEMAAAHGGNPGGGGWGSRNG